MELLKPALAIVAVLAWSGTYFWLAQRRRYYSKFKTNLFFAGSPVSLGWAAYILFENQMTGVVLGLAFASPLLLIVGIYLYCFVVEGVKGPARSKA